MSEILKFIIENFGRLRPFDYLLIVLIVTTLSLGIFFIFRWLFSNRFKAQSDLIELKEKMIGILQSQLDLLEKSKANSQKEQELLTARFAELNTQYSNELKKGEQKTELTRELLGYAFNTRPAFLVASLIILAYSRLAQLHKLLYLHMLFKIEDHFSNAPSAISISGRIDAITEKLSEADNAFDIYFSDDGLDTSLRLDAIALREQIVPDSLFQEIRDIEGKLTPYLDHVLEIVQKKQLDQ